ncbi:MAG: hypothetical protein ACFB9N_10790 [Geitlerinemataceae cyanobacterium]
MTTKTEETKATTALAVKSEAERTSYLGNRPVEPSTSKIVETFSAVGGARPIFATEMQVSDTIKASGIRPVAASTLAISSEYGAMGSSRPVASNEIDDASILMGYLD